VAAGDEIVLTVAEHYSNLLPWKRLAEESGARLRRVDVGDDGRLDPELVARLLGPRTRLVCFGHISNVLGAINPAREICRLAHEAGAKVVIDGTDRGVAPVTVTDLVPGDHEVILQTPIASARHVVNVQAGGTASLVTPVQAATANGGPVSGWLAVKSPFSLEIREEGRLLGTSDADRLMLAAGRHDIQLVSETMGYRVTRVVNVMPGKVENLKVDLPNGTMHVNASPWAEVWLDGQRIGETPIGNLSVAIGPHELVFKHPQFGEKRHAVQVTLQGPTRVSMDMK